MSEGMRLINNGQLKLNIEIERLDNKEIELNKYIEEIERLKESGIVIPDSLYKKVQYTQDEIAATRNKIKETQDKLDIYRDNQNMIDRNLFKKREEFPE